MTRRPRKLKATQAVPIVPIVPRLGPPENLRPAGPHTDRRRRSRAAEKAALSKAAFDVRPGGAERRAPSPQGELEPNA